MLAKTTVPHLVLSETPFINFLRTDNFNSMNACKRLLAYWKHRRYVFGEDHWLLPMIQTANGALPSSTIELVRSGSIIVVPGPAPVVVTEFARLKRPLGDDAIKWIYYLVTTLCTPAMQTDGVTMLHKLSEGHPVNLLPGIWKVIREALPVKLKRQVLIPGLEEGKERLYEFLLYQSSRVIESNSGIAPGVLSCRQAEERLQLLELQGIPRNTLPGSVGGGLAENYHHDWIRTRLTVEDILGTAFRNSCTISSASRPTSDNKLVARKRHAIQTSGGNAKESSRTRNAIHHQRWLEKERLKKSALEQRYKIEKTRNIQLTTANQLLTSLLAQAKYIVRVHAAENEDDNSRKDEPKRDGRKE